MIGVLRKNRKLAGETSWSFVDQVVSVVTSTITFLLLGRTLGAAGYGAYISLYALMGPFFSFGHAGVALAVLDHIVREKEDRLTVARSCVGLATWFAVLSLPVLVIAGNAVLKGSMSNTTMFFLIVADFGLMAIIYVQASIVQAVAGFNPAIRLRIATKVVRLLVVLALHLGGNLTLGNLAAASVISVAVQACVIDRRTARALGASAWPGRVRARHVRSMAVYSVGISCGSVQADGDKPIMTAAGHLADAGRYGAAYRLVSLGFAPVVALIGATHVDFLDGEGGPDNQFRKALRFAKLSAAYGLIFGAALWICAPIFPRMIGSEYEGTTSMIRWLAPLVLLRGAGTFPMNGLLGLGRNGLRTKLLLVNSAASLIMYFLLIPAHSWKGAIVGTLLSEASLFMCGWIALYRCQQTQLRPARVLEPV